MADASDSSGGELYRAYIERELDNESALKASLEARGVAVITSSGTFVTLLFGLVAVVTKSEGFQLPHTARVALYAAIPLFVVSAVAAIATNRPRMYAAVGPDELRAAVKTRWSDTARDASQRIAATDVKVLIAARLANRRKARLLMAAMASQIAALACVATAIGFLLYDS